MTDRITQKRKIADFMGWVHHEDKSYDDFEMNALEYDTNWNILMPVIDKISKIPLLNGDIPCTDINDTCYPITFNMPDECGNVMVRFKGGFLSKAPTLIEAAYNAVINFIENHTHQ